MPQSNLSHQPSNEPEKSSATTLARYKTVIQSIVDVLFYGENLRSIGKDEITMFERDLRSVIQGLQKLSHSPDLNQLLTSVDAVQESIRRAINELYIALDVIEQPNQEAESSRRAFYSCLDNCRRYLTEALQYFTI